MLIIGIVGTIYDIGVVIAAIPMSKFIAKHYSDLTRTQRGLMTLYMSLGWPYLLGLGIWRAIRPPIEKA